MVFKYVFKNSKNQIFNNCLIVEKGEGMTMFSEFIIYVVQTKLHELIIGMPTQ